MILKRKRSFGQRRRGWALVSVATVVAGGLTLAACTSGEGADQSPTFDPATAQRFVACLEANGLTAKLGDVPRATHSVFVRLGVVDWIHVEGNTTTMEYDPDAETFPDGTVQDLILSTLHELEDASRWVAPANAEAFGETQFAELGRIWAACESEVPGFAQQPPSADLDTFPPAS